MNLSLPFWVLRDVHQSKLHTTEHSGSVDESNLNAMDFFSMIDKTRLRPFYVIGDIDKTGLQAVHSAAYCMCKPHVKTENISILSENQPQPYPAN